MASSGDAPARPAQDPAMLHRLREFMRTPTPEVTGFLTTMTREGSPSARQVSYFVDEDFTVGTITGPGSLKVGHVRRNPKVGYVWVELTPQGPARMVSLEGDAEVVTDPAQVQDFLERRAAWRGTTVHQPSLSRWLIRTRPRLLRAERFLDERTTALVIRDFASLAIEYPQDPAG